MQKRNIIKQCPSCGGDLTITKLTCKNCMLELSGEFSTSDSFEGVSDEQKDFIRLFLKYEGNLSKMQDMPGENYLSVKNKLNGINRVIGNNEDNEMRDIFKREDQKVTKIIKEKLKSNGGKGTMSMLKGEDMDIYLSADNEGVIASGYPILTMKWGMFEEIVKKASLLGGNMLRGDAGSQAGAKIGSEDLPLDSIDAFVSMKYFNRQKGETTTRRSTYFAAVLDWAGIATNCRSRGQGGYIELEPDFLDYGKE